MSEHVEINADGLFIHKWNGKKKAYFRKRIKKLSACVHLRTHCEIAPGTTLRQIFDVVDKYKLLKMMISQYSWCRQIDEFHVQAREPMRDATNPDPDDRDPINHLEIYWVADVNEYIEKLKHPGGLRERIRTVDFSLSTGFHGIGPAPAGKEDDPAYRSEDGNIQYSVSASRMWKLADLPVILNKEIEVYEPFKPGVHSSAKRPEKLLDTEREFTLLEVLDAIYWDISFYGGPAESAEFLEEMNERIEEIKNGTAELIPLEDVIKKLEEESKDE